MATTSNTYTGNGSNKLFSITFPYLETSDIDVYLNGVLQTITTEYTFANATTVEFVAAPANGAVVLLDRSTDDLTLQATFFPGSSIKANDLNFNFDQVLYLSQETANIAANQSTAGLQTQITAANNTSNTALTTANAANATANGIAGTANTALTNANAAVVTANAASVTASSALSTANAAQSTANSVLTPPGTVQFYAADSAPAGYLKANGALINRTTYANLFAAIGTTFGAGDGSTTFAVPDLRGEFARGWDDARGVDSGRAFGSAQAQDYKSHNHSINDPGHSHNSGVGGFFAVGSTGVSTNLQVSTTAASQGQFVSTTGSNFTGITIQNNGGTETRPRNIALLAIIKF
jgi:microcystin-dependent protein